MIIAWLDNLASVFSAVSACAQENPLRAQVPCLKTFAKQHFVKGSRKESVERSRAWRDDIIRTSVFCMRD